MDDEELIRRVVQEVMGGWQAQATHPNDYDVYYIPRIGTIRFDLSNANHWMLVVERMRELGWQYEITTDITNWNYDYELNKVVVVFYSTKTMLENATDFESAPDKYFHKSLQDQNKVGHAICLAALKAVRNG